MPNNTTEENQKPLAEPKSDLVLFAKTNFRDQERVFGIKTDDRRRHLYVIGKTGMGKTTMIENMAAADVQNGRGIAIVDPHGEYSSNILNVVPKQRINDVIYFNPADFQYPIAFNILEKVAPEHKHLVADGLVGVFKKIWADSWGPRLEYILRNAILALLDYPTSTLLGVTRMLVDGSYRKKVVAKIKDPVVRSFWVDEFNNYSERFRNEAIAPIQNKVGQFLSTSLIRNIIGQPRSTINIREVMDQGKILIMNLSKGLIGEENSALLGAMMITKIQLAAMSRADMPEEKRRDFYLYVDEFQNFATESFAAILSEARKYHLNLIMAHQYIAQMPEPVRDAVFGNVGTLICFRVGAQDAEFLEREFMPIFTQYDLVNLPKFSIYLKLMIDGIASDAFSASTLPPLYQGMEGHAEKIIRVCRERYAQPRKEVEEKIDRWSGIRKYPAPGQNPTPGSAQSQAGYPSSKGQQQQYRSGFTPRPQAYPRQQQYQNKPYSKQSAQPTQAQDKEHQPQNRPSYQKPQQQPQAQNNNFNQKNKRPS